MSRLLTAEIDVNAPENIQEILQNVFQARNIPIGKSFAYVTDVVEGNFLAVSFDDSVNMRDCMDIMSEFLQEVKC